MTTPDSLGQGRDAFARRAWGEASANLSTADAAGELAVDDLDRLATAQYMLGRTDLATKTWERAHLAALREGEPVRATRLAFQILMAYGQRGDYAQAGGWAARASRVIEEAGVDCVERALVRIPVALQARDQGDLASATAIFEQLAASARRFGDAELLAMSCLGRGQTLIAMGETERGVALLDEAMVAVTAGEVSPINVGTVYCGSIEAFETVFDLQRAQEWTAALSRWFESQPDAAPFRGRCLVFRAEILQFHGRWQEADVEVERARDWLSRPPIEPAIGEAHYQRGELHRLRGEFAQAEASYREGAKWGRKPDPGLALTRLAQGDVPAASASIRRAVDEADTRARARLLDPFVEIMLAGGEIDLARAAATELAALASGATSPPLLRALAARADGLVQLAAADAMGSLVALRRASDLWRALDAPYESARVRVGLGQACRLVGDAEGAAIEFASARDVFERLGARPDRDRLDEISGLRPPTPGGLSPREVEVLRQLAGGRTNREIATDLGISERTVDRHVSNLYVKVGVTTRAAATGFAYEHGIVDR